MPINNLSLSENQVFHNTKIKVYPDGSTNITYCRQAIFKDSGTEIRENVREDVKAEVKAQRQETDELTLKREEQNEREKPARDRTSEMIRIHRDRVRDIVIMNDFTHFLTITFNPEEIDSFDVVTVRKKLNQWLKHQVIRKGLQYVLIPELHKSGRIHAHALINDVFKLVDSGKRTKSGKVIYNCPEWRYGFTTAIPLDDQKIRVANYVTKYITKGSDKIFGKYFWSSKNIQREPHVILTDTDFNAVNAEVFQPLAFNDNLQFKYESNFMYLADVPKCPLLAECKRKYPDRKYPPCNGCPNNLESSLDECAMLAIEMEDLQNE